MNARKGEDLSVEMEHAGKRIKVCEFFLNKLETGCQQEVFSQKNYVVQRTTSLVALGTQTLLS